MHIYRINSLLVIVLYIVQIRDEVLLLMTPIQLHIGRCYYSLLSFVSDHACMDEDVRLVGGSGSRRVVWKCVTMGCGEQCVVICGE